MKEKLFRIILTWACVYPIVTLLIFTLTTLGFQLPLWQQTLAITMILVPIMVLIIAPKVTMTIDRIAQQ
jgi:antibiotic biosynthesis monooxygenase (ABM) superfamily enzyme